MFYISISNGLLQNGHRKRIGSAVWEFMWLIDKITKIDEKGWGHVLSGRPIKLEEIDTSLSIGKISKNLHKLENQGYIKISRTPNEGIIIKVAKAKKNFGKKTNSDLPKTAIHHEERFAQNGKSDLPKTAIPYIGRQLSIKDNTNNTINKQAETCELNKIIDLFKAVNPTYEKLFKNNTQRTAMDRLIKKFGEQKVTSIIKALPGIINQPYAPRITTPLQLEDKLGQLVAFVKSKNNSLKNVTIKL